VVPTPRRKTRVPLDSTASPISRLGTTLAISCGVCSRASVWPVIAWATTGTVKSVSSRLRAVTITS
jgi:hypothetical protein